MLLSGKIATRGGDVKGGDPRKAPHPGGEMQHPGAHVFYCLGDGGVIDKERVVGVHGKRHVLRCPSGVGHKDGDGQRIIPDQKAGQGGLEDQWVTHGHKTFSTPTAPCCSPNHHDTHFALKRWYRHTHHGGASVVRIDNGGPVRHNGHWNDRGAFARLL